jgi:hypothetical protein
MTTVVRGDNQQPRAHGKSKDPDEGVMEANPVKIKSGCIANHRPYILMRAKKLIESLMTRNA